MQRFSRPFTLTQTGAYWGQSVFPEDRGKWLMPKWMYVHDTTRRVYPEKGNVNSKTTVLTTILSLKPIISSKNHWTWSSRSFISFLSHRPSLFKITPKNDFSFFLTHFSLCHVHVCCKHRMPSLYVCLNDLQFTYCSSLREPSPISALCSSRFLTAQFGTNVFIFLSVITYRFYW